VRGNDRTARRVTPGVEGLEARQLLTGAINDIISLGEGVRVGALAVNFDGAAWFAERNADGSGVDQIGRVTPGGFRSAFDLPDVETPRTIGALAPTPTGTVWYTATEAPSADGATPGAGNVGKIEPKGAVTEYPLPSPGDRPGTAVASADGGLWVAVSNPVDGYAIVKFDAEGSPTRFPLKDAASVNWLTLGKTGDLWFVDGEKIGKMTPNGEVSRFDLPAPADGSAIDLSNAHLTTASDGNIWFLGMGGLNRISPTGELKAFPAQETITSLGTASDGNLWFTFLPTATGAYSESKGALVGRMTPDGRSMVLPDRVDEAGTPVLRTAWGNDGSLWLDEGGATLSRISLASVPTFTPPIIRPTTQGLITVEPGKPVDGTIVSFVPNLAESTPRGYAATVDWGDGTVEPVSVVPNANGGYDVKGVHQYNGNPDTWYTVQVSVRDDSGGVSMIFNRVNVKTPAINPTPAPVVTPTPGPQNPNAGPWRTFPERPVRPNAPQAPTPTPARPTPVPMPTPIPTPTPVPTQPVATAPGNPVPAGNVSPVSQPQAPTPTPTPTPAVPARPVAQPAVDPWAAYRRPGQLSETISQARLPRVPRQAPQVQARRTFVPNRLTPTGVPRGPLSQFSQLRQGVPGARFPRR